MQDFLLSASDVWDQMAAALNEPTRVHAMLVHLPIAIGAIGLLSILALLVTGGKAHTLRWVCVVLYGLGGLAAWYATKSGDEALNIINSSSVPVTDEAGQQLSTHQRMGQWAWLAMVIPAAMVALTAIPVTAVRTITLLLALIAGVISTGWIVVTAHHGDAMIYVHGAGVATISDKAELSKGKEQVPSPATTPDSQTPAGAAESADKQTSTTESDDVTPTTDGLPITDTEETQNPDTETQNDSEL